MSASTDLVRWQSAVASGDAARVGALARTLATQKSKVDPEWVFTVCDNLWRPVGELGSDLIEASGTDPRNAVPSATITAKGTSPMIGELMKCRDTMVGIKVETAGLKFPFYVKKHTLSYKDGAHRSVSELRGIYSILFYYVILPTWWLPIQVQPISHAVYFGPIVTVIENMIAECALRIQSGITEFLNNALSLNPDVRAWFATLLQSDGNLFEVLKRPVYVVRTNPLLDGSPTVIRPVRMETVGQVITELTGPYGIDVSMTLWEPGDAQPDEWANLTHPTYVVRVRDRFQIEGPTKSILDSSIRTTVDLAGSLFGNAVKPLIQSVDGLQAAFVAPSLGVNFVEPWIILEVPEPGQRGSVLSAEIVDHAHEGWRHIVGGKSPAWGCAPPAQQPGGHSPRGEPLTQRSHQRHPVLADRLGHHRHRADRRPLGPAQRVPQRCVLRVPAVRPLRPPRRGRPVSPGRGALPRHPIVGLQRRSDHEFHQGALGE